MSVFLHSPGNNFHDFFMIFPGPNTEFPYPSSWCYTKKFQLWRTMTATVKAIWDEANNKFWYCQWGYILKLPVRKKQFYCISKLFQTFKQFPGFSCHNQIFLLPLGPWYEYAVYACLDRLLFYDWQRGMDSLHLKNESLNLIYRCWFHIWDQRILPRTNNWSDCSRRHRCLHSSKGYWYIDLYL